MAKGALSNGKSEMKPGGCKSKGGSKVAGKPASTIKPGKK